MAEFLSKDQLLAVGSHSYKTEGRSFLEEHILRFFWDFLMKFVPNGWAPNAMTLTGVMAMVVPFLALMAASPQAESMDVPCWCLFAQAFGLFVFQTLDNLDGRQARRTKSSNALGEFFDHGCDTISDAIMLFSYAIAVRLGTNPDLFFVIGLTIPFFDYCFFWRAHWTGNHVFGDVDISEIQWMVIAIVTLSGFTSTTGLLWDTSLFGLVSLKTLIVFIHFGFAVYYLGDVWYEALKFGMSAKNDKSKEQNTENGGRNVLAPLWPLLVSVGLATLARYLSGSVFEQYPIAFLCVYVLVVAKLSCRLIVANMTHSSVLFYDTSMISFLILLLTNGMIAPSIILMTPSAGVFLAIVFALVDFAKYFTGICLQLADHLGVNCLTIKSIKNN